MNVLSLFDGISCGQIALNRVGITYDNYYASEIDKYAIKIAMANYPNTIQLGGVENVDTSTLGKIDLLIGGSPCQSFSRIGLKNGMTTDENEKITSLDQYLAFKENNTEFVGASYLFWEYVRILHEVKPKYFLLENVVMGSFWRDVITSTLGVNPIKINSKLVSAQQRPRLYWTNIPNIKMPEDKKLVLKDILDTPYTGDYLTDEWLERRSKWRYKMMKQYADINKPANCLITGGSNGMNVFNDGHGYRKTTPEENEKLQTIPVGYTDHVSVSQRNKAIGNGWTVDVIAHMFKELKNVL